MSFNVISISLREFRPFILALSKYILSLFLLLAMGLFFDSKIAAKYFSNTQICLDILMLLLFCIIFRSQTRKHQRLMIIAIFISIFGECLFSLGMGMYTYRLHNVPLYVFPGHAIVFIATRNFAKSPAVKKYAANISMLLVTFICLFSTAYLFFFHDAFGFVLTCLTLFLLKNKPRERLFYLSMYIVVVFLEQVGTRYGCWYWPKTAWNISFFLSSANPPSGISFFYFGLDLGCLYIYKTIHKTAWQRMKNVRAIRAVGIQVAK